MSTSLVTTQRVELLREVADGPTAVLFAGEKVHEGLPSLVAVKVLRRGTARGPDQLSRARDAGRALSCLGHRHIVSATELAIVDDRPALIAPWVEGLDLLDWLEILKETGNPLPGRVACEIVRAAASALDAALHRIPWGAQGALGLRHLDVKPSNLMVDRDGELRMLDFCSGTSSLALVEPADAVRAGWAKYWCPARRAGATTGTPASDVYALGILAIELFRGGWLRRVRGSNPAHDRHLAEVVAALPDPGLRGAEDDRALRSLLLRMVAFDADARPSAVVVAKTLRKLADRAQGPTLESFAHDHVLPYIEPPLPVPGLPEARVAEPTAIAALPADEPVALLDHGADEDEEHSTGTERVAELTAQALRNYRRQRAAGHTMQATPEPTEETSWVADADADELIDQLDDGPAPALPREAPDPAPEPVAVARPASPRPVAAPAPPPTRPEATALLDAGQRRLLTLMAAMTAAIVAAIAVAALVVSLAIALL